MQIWMPSINGSVRQRKPFAKVTTCPIQQFKDRVWTMLDSGSEPTVANCKVAFPNHPIEESPAQRRGVKYMSATGGTVANPGQVHVVHRNPRLGDFNFTFQHAPVQCPIISIRDRVKGHKPKVLFYEEGGVIKYPDGRRIRFVKHSC